jgi:hypothetical protein
MKGTWKKKTREIGRRKRIGAEKRNACSRKPAPTPPFSRWRHRHGKKRTQSASILVEEGGEEEEKEK